MIAGFGNSSAGSTFHHALNHKNTLSLPVPFNIPKVLHNLIFEEIELDLDAKQKDLLEALRFSYLALLDLDKEFATKQADLKKQILKEPDNINLKDEYDEIRLDKQEANYDFKSLVEVILEVLEKKQIEALLRFSNILV